MGWALEFLCQSLGWALGALDQALGWALGALHLQSKTSGPKSKNFKTVQNVSLEVDLICLSCDLRTNPQLKSCELKNKPGVAQKSLKHTPARTKV